MAPDNRIEPGRVLVVLAALSLQLARAQSALPTFEYVVGEGRYTLVGRDPANGSATTIATLLVPVTLAFAAKDPARYRVMNPTRDIPAILASPIFSNFVFPSGGDTQYTDALLRTTFPNPGWHTLLGKPEVRGVKINIPLGYGYILTSKPSGASLAVADIKFVQKALFRQLGRQPGKLIIAVTHNTAYYALGDATVCCSWGTHGLDAGTGNAFVLGSYLQAAPAIVEDQDIQPLTQQLGQFIKDPLHDPLFHSERNQRVPGNTFPSWMRPASMRPGGDGLCGGTGAGSTYFLLEPTDINPKNNFPASKPFVAHRGGAVYHLQNIALLPWYTGISAGLGSVYSFPDAQALTRRSQPCRSVNGSASKVAIGPASRSRTAKRHQLIGYWAGYGAAGSTFPLRQVSPQWDVIIIAFSTPDNSTPEGTMQFHTPAGLSPTQFKSEIAYLKSRGKKVMISLGGGGQHFTLAKPGGIRNFISSVSRIITEYGFDGIDIDFETPSLSLDPGDGDFAHPVTPSIVNLIAAVRQLREYFGSRFMISLVPEGTQIPAGYTSYGGQFGSYLPLTHALRDILSFVDVQDYNTPPLQGLDGEIYQAGSVDYHAAMTELLLSGFVVGGDPGHFFPPMPSEKVAIGFLARETTPAIVAQALDYLMTGKPPAGTMYKLRKSDGYPGLLGAMFWTIDADRSAHYAFSNSIGLQLHGDPHHR